MELHDAAYILLYINGNDAEHPLTLARYNLRATSLGRPAWENQEIDTIFSEMFDHLLDEPSKFNASFIFGTNNVYQFEYNDGYSIGHGLHNIDVMDRASVAIAKMLREKDLLPLLELLKEFERSYRSRLMNLNAYNGTPIKIVKLRRVIKNKLELI